MMSQHGGISDEAVASRAADCEARKARILKKAKRLAAYRDIQNVMGRATAAFNFHDRETLLSHFALDLPDVSLAYADEGTFEGADGVRACLDLVIGGEPQPGELLDIQLTTPMIEVAGDVGTAKCVWWCCGVGTLLQVGDDPQAIWLWGALACDMVLEAGRWKIWHAHYFRLVKCDYHKGWVEDTSMENRPNIPLSPLAGPVLYHNPYTPLSVRDGIPCAPMPYETWTPDDLHWELSRDKG